MNERIEQLLEQVVTLLKEMTKREVKAWYTVTEFAAIVRREPFTCREWCRLGRINAERAKTGCGESNEWRISHAELERYQREGLLPLLRRSDRAA